MTALTYLSVCSGIEAATVAWHPLGWSPVAFAEIEAFPRAVLAQHYPSVPNWGDITRFKDWPDATVDVLVGGTPCQSFSVAGLRAGLADPRGNLALTYLAIADRYRAQWLVWENVPGVLSSDGGRDFGSIVGGMVELGYSPCWRVLDAQYVRVDGFPRAVPQRRRRVFVVGHLGDWRRSAAVLFEPESLQGNTAPRRQAGQGAAPTISARPTGGGGLGTDFDCDGGLIAADMRNVALSDVAMTLQSAGAGSERGLSLNSIPHIMSHDPAMTLTARERKGPLPEADLSTVIAHALRADGFDAGEDGTGRGTPLVPAIARTLTKGGGPTGDAGRRHEDDDNLIAFDTTQITSKANRSVPKSGDPSHPLAAGAHPPAIAFAHQQGGSSDLHYGKEVGITLQRHQQQAIAQSWAVRRLTPTECERLQGFPDGYTAILYRGKPAADGPRYKALGNSMAVNAMRWLGYRIQMVTDLVAEIARAA